MCHDAKLKNTIMAIKAIILKNVKSIDVPKRVAHEFSNIVNTSVLNQDIYTVISYPGNSNSIVNSKTLQKSLNKIESKNITAVAYSFTIEAQKMAEKMNIKLFYSSDFFWSDESLKNINEN